MRAFCQLLSLLLLSSVTCLAQNYSSLKGVVYTSKKELAPLANSFIYDTRIDNDRYIARALYDSMAATYVVLFEKESRTNGVLTFQILDLVAFTRPDTNTVIVIGSDERPKTKQHTSFILAVECCYDTKSWNWPINSDKVLQAWAFNKTTGRITPLKGKKLKRINEGYYRNS